MTTTMHLSVPGDLDVLLDIVETIRGRGTSPVGWNTRLSDAGLDSLARLELAVRVEEQLHRPVPDAVLLDIRTLADLRQHLQAAP